MSQHPSTNCFPHSNTRLSSITTVENLELESRNVSLGPLEPKRISTVRSELTPKTLHKFLLSSKSSDGARPLAETSQELVALRQSANRTSSSRRAVPGGRDEPAGAVGPWSAEDPWLDMGREVHPSHPKQQRGRGSTRRLTRALSGGMQGSVLVKQQVDLLLSDITAVVGLGFTQLPIREDIKARLPRSAY